MAALFSRCACSPLTLRRHARLTGAPCPRSLPAPLHSAADDTPSSSSLDPRPQQDPGQQLAVQPLVPPYGQRKGWKPKSQQDFGDGGAYPECHVAQYPLELGRKRVSGHARLLSGGRDLGRA